MNTQSENYAKRWQGAIERRGGLKNRVRRIVRRGLLECATLLPLRRSAAITCLTGHYVFDNQIDELRQLLQALKRIGRFISTEELVGLIRKGQSLNERLFHLSFDDGFLNVIENGLPVILDMEVPVALFVPTDFIGADFGQASEFCRKENYSATVELATWDQLRSVDSDLVEIGAHTRKHTVLADVSDDPERLADEVGGSKQRIESELGECRYFAYPRGKQQHFDQQSEEAVKNAGYEAAFAAFRGRCQPGEHHRLFQIPRQHFELEWPLRHIKTLAAKL